MSIEPYYVSLLGLAEYFRTCNPANITACVQCLRAILNFKPLAHIEIRTHIQIANILSTYGKNIDSTLLHIEQAWNLSQSIHGIDDLKIECAILYAELLDKKDRLVDSIHVLLNILDISQSYQYFHCKALFLLTSMYIKQGNYQSAVDTLSRGSDYASRQHTEYTRLLFLISLIMVLLISKRTTELNNLLTSTTAQLEAWNTTNVQQKETLRIYLLIIQVTYLLMCGQVKTVKPALRQLQQTIQNMTSLPPDEELLHTRPPIELFQWLSKEQMCIVVYLVTVIHSMLAGYMEKAQKYTDKALAQIDKLKTSDTNPLLLSLQIMLLENMVLCRIITGNHVPAVKELLQIAQISQSTQALTRKHSPQLHTLLGMLSMSLGNLEFAENQFRFVLNTTDFDLRIYLSLSLSLIYMRSNKMADASAILDDVEHNQSTVMSHGLKAMATFLRALQTFLEMKFHDSKKFVRDTLRVSSAEDLNRLTSFSLALFGHVYLCLGNYQDSLNMVNPSMQLAIKIPDIQVQIWAASLLRDIYEKNNDESAMDRATTQLEQYKRAVATDLSQVGNVPENRIIQWIDGPCPFVATEKRWNSQ